MREFVALQPQLPLVFDNHGPTPVHARSFSSTDVVESPPAARPRFHPNFTTATSLNDHVDDPETGSDPTPRGHPNHDHHGFSLNDNIHDARRSHHEGPGESRHEPRDASHDEPGRGHEDGRTVRALLRRDRDERRRERERTPRRSQGRLIAELTRRSRSPERTESVDPRRHSSRDEYSAVWFAFLRGRHHRARIAQSDVPIGYHRRNGSADRMDTQTRSVRAIATGPLQGVAVAMYFVLLPYVVETKWRSSYTVTNGALLRDLLVGLGIFWIIFLVLVIVYVHQLRYRRLVPGNGCAWLAGLIIVALPFLISASADASVVAPHPQSGLVTSITTPHDGVERGRHHPVPNAPSSRGPLSAHELELVTLALASKGRRDRLHRSLSTMTEEDLDEVAYNLHAGDAYLIGQLRDVVGSDIDGESLVTATTFELEPRLDFDPVAISLLGPRATGFALGYAREGGTLSVDPSWSEEELVSRVVALHDGVVILTHSTNELLRALARRRDLSTLVIFLGDPAEIDHDLRELYVGVRAATGSGPRTGPYRDAPTRDVRIELLRAYPRVGGLVDDFTPSLRRRCTEMVAYLAMHSGEPVTGERLRSRVLVHANVDASKATLTNTASCVRRSLGADAQGYLLEPVSSGLYHLRGVGLDVADFHRLVARSRSAEPGEAYELYVEALRLVHGEPLASVLKGFEWFSFEGHRAQLQRDGEWVALALHEAAIAREEVEIAFWALRQGLLLDPESDDLLDALTRVPRLRQFGGDGTSAAQDHPVSPSRAVSMTWAFERFGR